MEPATRDETVPGGPWEFGQDVTAVFDDMLARSIPQYDTMRTLIRTLAVSLAGQDSEPMILDIGCSRGESIAELRPLLPKSTRYLGIDSSAPMVAAAKQRFANDDAIAIEQLDLRESFPGVRATVTLSVLTLQFVPLEHRQRVVHDIFQHTRPGGALILVEKLLGTSSVVNETMVNTYEAMKAANGYTTEQIDRKRASLEGVLVPLTAGWNEDLLRHAGFRYIDCFWRWMNFAGWIGVKPAH